MWILFHGVRLVHLRIFLPETQFKTSHFTVVSTSRILFQFWRSIPKVVTSFPIPLIRDNHSILLHVVSFTSYTTYSSFFLHDTLLSFTFLNLCFKIIITVTDTYFYESIYNLFLYYTLYFYYLHNPNTQKPT